MTNTLPIIGMYQLKQKKYVKIGFDGKFKDSYGDADEGFLAIFFGNSGSGKTEAAVQLAKYMERFGKVLYLSFEQKDRSTIRTAFERNGMLELNKRVYLSPGADYDTVMRYLSTTKMIKTVCIDSVDYSKWTYEQVKAMREAHPKKNFIVVAHGRGGEPKKAVAQDIRFDADMKCHVKKYVVFPDSRFEGPDDPYIVHPEKAMQFHPYLFTDDKAAPVEKPPKKKKRKKKIVEPQI